METITKTTGILDNSWWSDSTSKTTNVIDIYCTILQNSGTAKISIDKPGETNPGIFFIDGATMQNHILTELNIGYNTTYKITGVTTGGQTANCKIQEHTSSIPMDFMLYDFPIIFMVGLYFLFFVLGLKISFFR